MTQKLKTGLIAGVICGITGGIASYLGYFRFIHPYFAPHRTILAGILLIGLAFLALTKYIVDKRAHNAPTDYSSKN